MLRRRCYSRLAAALAKKNLIGLSLEQLQHELATIPEARKYTAQQVWEHMYRRGITDFQGMTNLSKTLRSELDSRYKIHYGHVQLAQVSRDQTRKWLVGFADDPRAVVESVLIPEPDRATLCVSSQIGCSLQCSFCHTGTQKLFRSLTASEVVGQYMIAAKEANDFNVTKKTVSNMVFMGQGEPLYNWRQVRQAIKVLTDTNGIAMPKHKITVSTSGVVPLIPNVASDVGVSLAISLHATRNDLRDVLVPLNKTFPLELVLEACTTYAQLMGNRGRRITFEYVMLDGVNDSQSEARDLVRLLRQLPSHVNLIPFNPWPGSIYRTSKLEKIENFARIVMEGGVHCTVRRPRGQDIMAACGQLKSSAEKKRNLVA
ncbi:23S rRNA methyltransferase [Lichtheimia ornata]|uniref:23S rRNA methyltransferase n=1 Tax=Lichtheimia ornata TaxID=688661 RepID=A0AAD7V3K8_9FUNG|nr:23S rRNA methyltransferase [Lichtheimia ornata]KAJ8658674.1 23S rRNA methyltransferase [Lichtheimia ornata]